MTTQANTSVLAGLTPDHVTTTTIQLASIKPLPSVDATSVSVVVPSHNHAPFIQRCLRSIIRQTHRPLELIVIDDGSNDDSIKRIEQELKNCPFDSELLVRPHRGLVATLNEGLQLSRGKYFAYLGSDDVWLAGFLASRVALLQSRSNAVLAYGHSFVINEKDQIVECTHDWAPYRDGFARDMLLHQVVPFSTSVVYRREALKRHSWKPEGRLEDYDLYLRLSVIGEFAFDTQTLCAWRSHRYNKSRNLDFMLSECLEAQRRAVATLNLSSDELEKANSELRWRYAADFIRAGQKRKAIKLMCSNFRGASSYRSVARMMVALSVPHPMMKLRKRLIEQRATKHYGSIQV